MFKIVSIKGWRKYFQYQIKYATFILFNMKEVALMYTTHIWIFYCSKMKIFLYVRQSNTWICHIQFWQKKEHSSPFFWWSRISIHPSSTRLSGPGFGSKADSLADFTDQANWFNNQGTQWYCRIINAKKKINHVVTAVRLSKSSIWDRKLQWQCAPSNYCWHLKVHIALKAFISFKVFCNYNQAVHLSV